ncbi:Sulfotransferase [Hordeum vulgare]|nr:Sulfotransferase [Hordeum vulgare]
MPPTIVIRHAIYTPAPAIADTHPPSAPFSFLHHFHHGLLVPQSSFGWAHIEQKKEMPAIVVGSQAARQLETDDDPIKDVIDGERTLPSSPAPLSLVHCCMTIGEAHAHYMDMMWDEPEEQFWETQTDAAYNLQLLKEHR